MFKKKNIILILGGSEDQLYLIKTAQKNSYETLCLDKNKFSDAKKISDYFINVDFSKIELVKKKIEKFKNFIAAVITMGSDCPVEVSKIANYLKLPSNSVQTSIICKNKFKMKNVFKLIKLNSAKFIYTNSVKATKVFFKKNNNKPIIIKPINLAGSRGVYLLNSIKEIEIYTSKIKKIVKNKKFLVEEYLSGPHISTETIIKKKKAFTLGFADRNYNDTKKFLPQIIENGGTVPSKNLKYFNSINNTIEKLANFIGFENGVIKGDFVINDNKIKIIEFAGRLSGGDFCESLVPLSTNYNYVKDVIDVSINKKKIKIPKRLNYKKYVKNRYIFLKSGKIEKIKGLNLVKKISGLKKISLKVSKDSIIKKATSHGSRAGVFVAESKTEKNLDKIIDKVYSTLKFKINGNFVTGDPR